MTIDRQTGHIYVYELVPVGEPDEETGEYSEFEERDVTPDDVSRIAAQNAKGVIASIVREAGRQSIYEEFSDRVGDLVTGTVLQGTPDFTIIKIRDGVEAELPPLRREAQPQRAQRASEQRALPPQPAPQGAHHRSARPELRRAEDARRAGAPGHRGVAHASGPHPPPVRDRGAGDLRRHGGDQVHRPRARRPLQDRRGVARGEPRSRGRLRRPEGQPRSHGGGRAAQRARRRDPSGRRIRRCTWPTRCRLRR